MPTLRVALPVLFAIGCGLVLAGPSEAQQPKEGEKKQPKQKKAKSWDEVTDAAVGYLKTTQAEDGSWSKAAHPGITSVVLSGLFRTGKATADDPIAAKGLKFVEGYIDPKDGSLAVGDIRHKFYVTSNNLLALADSKAKKYEPVIAAAATYMKKGQVGADDMKKDDDVNFGGFGYGPGSRGDLSNTHYVLEALAAAGTPRDDPAFKRAAVFVSRTQNLKSEFNTAPWAAKTDDGSFIYLPSAGPNADADAARPGYGSMTWAGAKSLTLCGVPKDDPRVKKALEWASKNYSVDINPGRQEGAGGQGYYNYLASLTQTLDLLGIDEIRDANGKAHDWRADVFRALSLRQRKDGSWGSDFATWMETNSDLDTAYALLALAHAKPKPAK